MGKRLFIFFCFYISGLALLLWKSKTNGPTVMESDVRRLKCAKFMNGKLKPAVLLSDPDAPSPQGLSVSESPQFSLLSHESTCEEWSCFIKKPFFPCLLILHHNHHGGHLHVLFIFFIRGGSYPHCSISSYLLPLWILWHRRALADFLLVWCPGQHLFWIDGTHVISVIRYSECLSCSAPALTAFPLSPYTAIVPHQLLITISWNASHSWIWQCFMTVPWTRGYPVPDTSPCLPNFLVIHRLASTSLF